MIGAQLQKAIFDALTAANVCGARIYDGVPTNPVFPYVTIGDDQVLDDGNSCADGWDVTATIHIWDRPTSGSRAALKTQIAQAVTALRGINTVDDFNVIYTDFENSRVIRDPDGITLHGIASVRFVLDPI